MFHPQQNFDSCQFFLIRVKTLWTHATHTTYAKVYLTPRTNPRTHTTHATHAIWQTREININHKDNGLTTSELNLKYFFFIIIKRIF